MMFRLVVRAVGIEPTLLAEPDFEWGAPHVNGCFIYIIFTASTICVRICVSYTPLGEER